MSGKSISEEADNQELNFFLRWRGHNNNNNRDDNSSSDDDDDSTSSSGGGGGDHHPNEVGMMTPNCKKKIVRDFRRAIHRVNEIDRKDLMDAIASVPGLVQIESNPMNFLKREDYDYDKAAKRLASYWKYRKEFFGRRAFLPMTIQGDGGAMSNEDIAFLRKGGYTVLPNHPEDGRAVVLVDVAAFRNVSADDPSTATAEKRKRCFFYVAHVASQNEKAATDGTIALVHLDKSLKFDPVAQVCVTSINNGLPFKCRHHIFLDTGGGSAFYQVLVSFVTVAVRIGGMNIEEKMVLHAHPSSDDFLPKLLKLGLKEEDIPVVLGGTWCHDDWLSWMESRQRLEGQQSHDSSSDSDRKPPAAAAQKLPGAGHPLQQDARPVVATLPEQQQRQHQPQQSTHLAHLLPQQHRGRAAHQGSQQRIPGNNQVDRKPPPVAQTLPRGGSLHGSLSVATLPEHHHRQQQQQQQQQQRTHLQYLQLLQQMVHLQGRDQDSQMPSTSLNNPDRKPPATVPPPSSGGGMNFLQGYQARAALPAQQQPNQQAHLQGRVRQGNRMYPSHSLGRKPPPAQNMPGVNHSLQEYLQQAMLAQQQQQQTTHLSQPPPPPPPQQQPYLQERARQESQRYPSRNADQKPPPAQRMPAANALQDSLRQVFQPPPQRQSTSVSGNSLPLAPNIPSNPNVASLPPANPPVSQPDAYDLKGLSYHPKPENECTLKKARESFNEALAMIHKDEKSAYLEALEKAPQLVETESDPLKFIRVEDFDSWSAARRFVMYWELRKELFGTRAFLPLKQIKGGALSESDVLSAHAGVLAFLPRDAAGRQVIAFDKGRLLDYKTVSIDSQLRAQFYVESILSEDERNTREGFVGVFFVVTPSRLVDFMPSVLEKWIQLYHCMPITMKACHLITHIPKTKHRKVVVDSIVSCAMEAAKVTLKDKAIVHTGHSEKEILEKLKGFGLCERGLPFAAGGSWRYEEFKGWMSERASLEAATEPDGQVQGPSLSQPPPDGDSKAWRRRKNVLQSRQKRERRRAEENDLREKSSSLATENARLKQENDYLALLLSGAKRKIDEIYS